MKKILLGILIVVTPTFTAWFFTGGWHPEGALAVAFIMLFFMVHPLGAFWMLYKSTRYEEKPFLYIFLAFIPYAFVWYYFARVKTGEYKSRKE